MKKLYTLLSIALISVSASAQVVISQVYGGGGNGGSVYNNDFIELYNRGTVAVSINGWSVQYASATGSNWSSTNLPNVTIQPGKYYLIQQAAGAGTPGALPTPDLNGITCSCSFQTGGAALDGGIAMSGTNGKVILVNTTTQETTTNPTGTQIIDKVGFGSANGFEGSAATAVLSNGTGALRNNNGCTDTNNNGADFTVGTPAPRNSATAANSCSTASVGENQIAGLKVYPNPVTNGVLFISTDANSEKSVAIFDVLGKQVVKTTATESVNVSNLKGGVYIVKITEEGKTATRKLVIK